MDKHYVQYSSLLYSVESSEFASLFEGNEEHERSNIQQRCRGIRAPRTETGVRVVPQDTVGVPAIIDPIEKT